MQRLDIALFLFRIIHLCLSICFTFCNLLFSSGIVLHCKFISFHGHYPCLKVWTFYSEFMAPKLRSWWFLLSCCVLDSIPLCRKYTFIWHIFQETRMCISDNIYSFTDGFMKQEMTICYFCFHFPCPFTICFSSNTVFLARR